MPQLPPGLLLQSSSQATFPVKDAPPKAMGLATFYSNLGQILATFSSGYIAELYGWQAPFVLGAVFGLAGMLPSVFRFKRNPAAERGVSNIPALVVGREKDLLIVSGLAVLVQYMTFATMYGFTPIHAEKIGLPLPSSAC